MFGNVLVGVDGRSGGRDAIAFAKQLVDRGARITLVHVYGDVWTLGRGGALLLAIERADSEQMLERERDAASVEAELLSSPASAVGRALHELAEHQRDDGTWDEPQYTGTGFPGDFYINYHLYRLVFPVSALGRYLAAQS